MREARIIVNYYNDEGSQRLEPGIIPHFNSSCTRYFEATIQQKIHESLMYQSCDYFGILSWKTLRKTGISPLQAKRFIESDTDNPDYYWLKLKEMSYTLNPWCMGHGSDLFNIANTVLKFDSGFLYRETYAIFCQYYLVTPEIFNTFMSECMNPVIRIMDSGRYDDILSQRVDYNESKPSQEQLIRIFGFPYYTWHPFIIERLFPSFAAMKGWRGKLIS